MPDPDKEQEPFDFSLVMSDQEMAQHKRLALNLSGLGRKFANAVDELALRKKRYESKRDDKSFA